jgi:hypothetical protein
MNNSPVHRPLPPALRGATPPPRTRIPTVAWTMDHPNKTSIKDGYRALNAAGGSMMMRELAYALVCDSIRWSTAGGVDAAGTGAAEPADGVVAGGAGRNQQLKRIAALVECESVC